MAYLFQKYNSRYNLDLIYINKIYEKKYPAFDYLKISLFILSLGFEMKAKMIAAVAGWGFLNTSIREKIKINCLYEENLQSKF